MYIILQLFNYCSINSFYNKYKSIIKQVEKLKFLTNIQLEL